MNCYDEDLDSLSKEELISRVRSSLKQSNSLKYLLDSLHGISWELDRTSNKFTYVSSSFTKVLGYDTSQLVDFDSLISMVHEEDKQRVVDYCTKEMQEAHNHAIEYRMIKNNGDVIWVLDVVAVGKKEDGKEGLLCGFILDVTQKKEAQLKLEKEHQFLETIINGIADPIMIIKDDYSVDIMNDAVKKEMVGRTFMDPCSPKCYEISHYRDTPCDGVDDPCPLRDVLESGKATTVIHNHRHSDGSDNFVELAASPLFDDDGKCVGIIEAARNVNKHIELTTALQEKTKQLSYEATHDHLTGLGNRALFMDRLEQSIKDARRNDYPFALFFMDLDYFKEINDTMGHHVGDMVLVEVCRRFQEKIRENDVLSRLGGDEFTLILKGIQTKDDVAIVAQKFVDIFKEPLIIEGNRLKLSVSIGICMYPENGSSVDEILQHADTAMYDAKAKGKSNFQFI